VQRGVFHCFTGGPREAARAVELGFHLSFSGVVTYPKNTELRVAAAAAPPERILIETDCPFLPPQSARGRRNEPALLRETAECLAQLRGSTLAELAALTSANARALFRLPS
jgi:TatD DNase family protein